MCSYSLSVVSKKAVMAKSVIFLPDSGIFSLGGALGRSAPPECLLVLWETVCHMLCKSCIHAIVFCEGQSVTKIRLPADEPVASRLCQRNQRYVPVCHSITQMHNNYNNNNNNNTWNCKACNVGIQTESELLNSSWRQSGSSEPKANACTVHPECRLFDVCIFVNLIYFLILLMFIVVLLVHHSSHLNYTLLCLCLSQVVEALCFWAVRMCVNECVCLSVHLHVFLMNWDILMKLVTINHKQVQTTLRISLVQKSKSLKTFAKILWTL